MWVLTINEYRVGGIEPIKTKKEAQEQLKAMKVAWGKNAYVIEGGEAHVSPLHEPIKAFSIGSKLKVEKQNTEVEE